MNPPPLTWTKATFHVPIRPPGESKIVPFPVAGIVSGPFGVFRGKTKGPDREESQPRFSLVLLACGRFLSTSARRAEELAPLEVAWTATDPYAVTGPGGEWSSLCPAGPIGGRACFLASAAIVVSRGKRFGSAGGWVIDTLRGPTFRGPERCQVLSG